MASMAHISVLVLDLTFGEVYDEPQRAQPGLRPEPRICLTMKSMKDMKKAVAEFRSSYTTMLAEVTVEPLRRPASPFGRRPNLFMLFMVSCLFFICTNHRIGNGL